jgi:hypothetical protein
MKLFGAVVICAVLAFLFLGIPGCKKNVDPGPEYPQILGKWSGSTSQSQPINIYLDYFNQQTNIYQYNVVVYFNSGGSRTISGFNSEEGITQVTNKAFYISLGTGIYGPAYIEGTFNVNNLTLSGTFRIYNPNDPNDATSGYYSALLN